MNLIREQHADHERVVAIAVTPTEQKLEIILLVGVRIETEGLSLTLDLSSLDWSSETARPVLLHHLPATEDVTLSTCPLLQQPVICRDLGEEQGRRFGNIFLLNGMVNLLDGLEKSLREAIQIRKGM